MARQSTPPAIHHSLFAEAGQSTPPAIRHSLFAEAWQSTPLAIRHSLFAEHTLLSLRVLDPACGSGHFLLAAARRLGKELAKIRTGKDEPDPDHVREAIRDVVSHCIYGVDKNPLAVELCRVALWLEAHCVGKPLTFLDHHIKCGDSLVGVRDLAVLETGIPDEAFAPVSADAKPAASLLKKRNKKERHALETGQGQLPFGPTDLLAGLQAQRHQIEAIADDSPADVRRKKSLYDGYDRDPQRRKLAEVCNMWTAAFFQPLTPEAAQSPAAITTQVVTDHLADRKHPRAVAIAEALAVQQHFFHWPLEFPEVFGSEVANSEMADSEVADSEVANSEVAKSEVADSEVAKSEVADSEVADSEVADSEVAKSETAIRHSPSTIRPSRHSPSTIRPSRHSPFADVSGFDVVLSNPPWERIKLQEEEFFAGRDARIAQAPNAAARKRLIAGLPVTNPDLWDAYQRALHRAESASRFLRGSRQYPLTGRGDINTYSVFAERLRRVLGARGRAGIILPTGIATDDTNKSFFADLVEKGHLVSLFDFENREKLFQAVDSRMKFCLLTLTGGSEEAGSEVANSEVANSEMADSEVANSEVADSEVANSEVADSEVADSEVAKSETAIRHSPSTIRPSRHSPSAIRPSRHSPLAPSATFAFFATRADHLRDPRRVFSLTAADIARINPNTRTLPVFRTRQDADMTRAIYERVPVLVNEREVSGEVVNGEIANSEKGEVANSEKGEVANSEVANSEVANSEVANSEVANSETAIRHSPSAIRPSRHSPSAIRPSRHSPSAIRPAAQPNPWGVRFLRMFDMSNDSHLFRTRTELEKEGYRLVGNVFVKEEASGEEANSEKGEVANSEKGEVANSEVANSEVANSETAIRHSPSAIRPSRHSPSAIRPSRHSPSAIRPSRHSPSAIRPAATRHYLPLYEAKMIWHYDHRYGTYEGMDSRSGTQLPTPDGRQHADPQFVVQPWYWVPAEEVRARLADWKRGWLMGFRDVTNATNERTAIFSLLPKVGAGHTLPILLTSDISALHFPSLLANLNVLAFDWVLRQKIGGAHLTFFILRQLPVLPPAAYSPEDLRFIVPRVLELTCTAWDLQPFADDVWQEADDTLRAAIRTQWEANRREANGEVANREIANSEVANSEVAIRPTRHSPFASSPLAPFIWNAARRAQIRAELDAYYARLYGLTRKQLRYILDPADLTERELEDILDPWEERGADSEKGEVANSEVANSETAIRHSPTSHSPSAHTFPGETFRVLKEKEIRQFGEYRTRRLVLEAWHRLTGGGNT
ncbi:Eco57I restriction-modification methylase domain-containing protein [Chloracidobacterium aggregatum]|uniref:Eco57I restriction-modification methylase domain-containing protein n=1 Tax=Chloracidobacterium aggregatum TaxID=2851959 RepID=UPI0031B85A42